jgi:hypothetical protein
MADVYNEIKVLAGVKTSSDATDTSTQHFIDTTSIRFRDGLPEKIGGWDQVPFDGNKTINGACRSIYSYNYSTRIRYILGTNSHLYYYIGSVLTNISPLVTSTTAIANSLDSNYATLGSNPITTVLDSTTITIADTATKVRAGDSVTLSGSSAVNGIPAIDINTTHLVRTQATNSYTVIVATAATSSGTGGGGSVVQATKIVTVNQTSHGFADDDRVKIASAATFAGIPAGDLNQEHLIRNTLTNAYDIVVDTTATSSVTGGGGASTTVQGQIAAGEADGSYQQGYGAGLYGIGLYGTALQGNTGIVAARSWTIDRFGDNLVMTAGQQTGVYTWDSNSDIAPVLLSGAPTAVNYVFVSNEIVVVLGAGGATNRIQWSDQGVYTSWTATATNQAGQDDIEGAGGFVSHIRVRGINLLFTDSQVYTFRYLGRPLIWEIKLLDEKSGIIAKNARIQHNGVAYWMGSDNFYLYKGGNVEIIPSNSGVETTLKKFIYDDISTTQLSKIFCWFNRKFNEIWFHIPSLTANEPDKVIRVNVKDYTWTPDTIRRSAGEYPTQLQEFPYLADRINGTSDLYQHEKGSDNNGSALSFSITTPYFHYDDNTVNLVGLVPDSIQTGNITVTINSKKYPQSSSTFNTKSLTITPTTEVQKVKVGGRFIQYVISGNATGQSWRAGKWIEILRKGGKR